MAWRLAKSLEVLREQVNKLAPDRDKSWDGTIGDEAHAARTSDHNAWITDPGGPNVVSAMDITHDIRHGFDSYVFAEQLRLNRDARIKYVISNGRIFGDEGYGQRNGVPAWTWTAYHGPSPHDHHVHVSVDSDKPHYDDIHPWQFGSLPAPQPEMPPNKPMRPVLKRGDQSDHVAYLQRMLGIPADGRFGPQTEKAVIEFQQRFGLVVDGIVGPHTWTQLEE